LDAATRLTFTDVVITPNVTGSTGYGQAFTDAIRKDWGGAPYNDLVNVVDWIEKNMPEVDMTRAVALGASYGGYMVNWLNGHDLGRRFKALVCHDGIFSFAGGLLATEELYFPFHVSQPLSNRFVTVYDH
jgi:dipeptidyl aminopeptidase/acylaminoacyl peptidase